MYKITQQFRGWFLTLLNPEEYGREKTISLASLEGSSDVEGLSDLGLLTQAGYLTIKAIKYMDTVYLDYPNQEVKRAMARCIWNNFLMAELQVKSEQGRLCVC